MTEHRSKAANDALMRLFQKSLSLRQRSQELIEESKVVLEHVKVLQQYGPERRKKTATGLLAQSDQSH